MSVEFTLVDNRLGAEEWDDLLADWAGEQEDALFDEPVFEGGIAHLLGQGSVRGALVQQGEDGEIGLRMCALSSRADWRMGFSIMRRAIEAGGGELEHEDGRRFGAAELGDAQAEAMAVEDFCGTAAMVHGHAAQGTIELPLGGFALTLGPLDVPARCTAAEQAAIEERLAARVERYATAYKPMIMVLQGGARLTTWARIPTIVGPAHLVAIEGIADPVPRARVVELLGERAEAAGERTHYLPELDLERDRALLDALRAEAVEVEAWVAAHRDELAREAAEEAARGRRGGAAADDEDDDLEDEDGDLAGDDDDDDLDEGDPTDSEAMAPYVDCIARAILEGLGPEAVIPRLQALGMPAEVATLQLQVVSQVLSGLFGEGDEQMAPDELLDAIMEEGVPPPLAFAALSVISRIQQLGE